MANNGPNFLFLRIMANKGPHFLAIVYLGLEKRSLPYPSLKTDPAETLPLSQKTMHRKTFLNVCTMRNLTSEDDTRQARQHKVKEVTKRSLYKYTLSEIT